jgi:hypothetical protein
VIGTIFPCRASRENFSKDSEMFISLWFLSVPQNKKPHPAVAMVGLS